MKKRAPTFWLPPVQALLDRYLALDPEISQELSALDGRIIAVELTVPSLTLFLLPEGGRIQVMTETLIEPDSILRGSVFGLLNLARSERPAEMLSRGEVAIEGDNRLVQDFSDILRRIEIDWEELLSKVMGDLAAHRLGSFLRQGADFMRDSFNALRMDSSEYLREESGILPTRMEVEEFMRAVDELRDDCSRLEARLRKLERRP